LKKEGQNLEYGSTLQAADAFFREGGDEFAALTLGNHQ